MYPDLQFITTADGSKTIFHAGVGENYHSRHGALQESTHVFLNSGLRFYLAGAGFERVSILEVGFGTGLNFLLSADYCESRKIALNYTGIEAYPLPAEMICHTGYHEYIPQNLWAGFNRQYTEAMRRTTTIGDFSNLNIACCKLMDFSSTDKYDVIYFDAFAAAHQPEMWNEEAIGHTVGFLKRGGVFVTYAITGNLKRTLKSLGLKVEKATGAPGKREMLRAVNR